MLIVDAPSFSRLPFSMIDVNYLFLSVQHDKRPQFRSMNQRMRPHHNSSHLFDESNQSIDQLMNEEIEKKTLHL